MIKSMRQIFFLPHDLQTSGLYSKLTCNIKDGLEEANLNIISGL